MCFRIAHIQVALGLLFLCVSCSRPKNVDQQNQLEARRDVQNVFYVIVMAVGDVRDKPASLPEIMNTLVAQHGKAFFTAESAGPIYVSRDKTKWASALKAGASDDVAVFTKLQLSTGEAVLITKTFTNHSYLMRNEDAQAVHTEEFWQVDTPSSKASLTTYGEHERDGGR